MLYLEQDLILENFTEQLTRITTDLKTIEQQTQDTLLDMSLTLAALVQQSPKNMPELNRLFSLCLRRLLGLDPHVSAKTSVNAVIGALDSIVLALRLTDLSKRQLLLTLAYEQLKAVPGRAGLI